MEHGTVHYGALRYGTDGTERHGALGEVRVVWVDEKGTSRTPSTQSRARGYPYVRDCVWLVCQAGAFYEKLEDPRRAMEAYRKGQAYGRAVELSRRAFQGRDVVELEQVGTQVPTTRSPPILT